MSPWPVSKHHRNDSEMTEKSQPLMVQAKRVRNLHSALKTESINKSRQLSQRDLLENYPTVIKTCTNFLGQGKVFCVALLFLKHITVYSGLESCAPEFGFRCLVSPSPLSDPDTGLVRSWNAKNADGAARSDWKLRAGLFFKPRICISGAHFQRQARKATDIQKHSLEHI